MKTVGAVLVVLALVASVVWLTIRTSLDAPAPREADAGVGAATSNRQAKVDVMQGAPFKESVREQSLHFRMPPGAPATSVRVQWLDARLESIGPPLPLKADANDPSDIVMHAPLRTHAVRLAATTEDGAFAEFTRVLGEGRSVALPALEDDELCSRIRLEILGPSATPCAQARAWRSTLDVPRTTGRDGLLNLPFHENGWVIAADGCARQRVRGEPWTTLRVTLAPATHCELRIVNEAGTALAGARVRIPELDQEFTADAEGLVRCEALPAERDNLTLVITGNDEEHLVQPVPAGPGPIRVQLTRGLRAEGRVLDATGAPIEEADVLGFTAEEGVLVAIASTDRSGRFRLPAIGPGPHVFIARHYKHQTAVLECTLPATSSVELALARRAAPARITCTSSANKPVRCASVSLLVKGCLVHADVTDVAGQVELPVIPEAELLVDHPLHELLRMPAPGSGQALLTLHERRHLFIGVTSTDSGSFVTNITTTLRSASGEVIWFERSHFGDIGKYWILAPRGHRDEMLQVEVSAPEFSTATHAWGNEPNWVSVLLAPRVPVNGRVVSAASGAALEGARIYIAGVDEPRAVSDRDGNFFVEKITDGACRFIIVKDGFVSMGRPVPDLRQAGSRNLGTFALHQAGSIFFAGPGGALPDEAVIRLEHLTGTAVERVALWKGRRQEIHEVRTGRWLAILQAPGTELDGDRRIVDVAFGEASHVVFKPNHDRASVRGKVEIADERLSVAGLMVRARATDGTLLTENACTREGTFSLENLPLTGCSLEALLETAHGNFSGSMELELTPGENPVTLKLTRK